MNEYQYDLIVRNRSFETFHNIEGLEAIMNPYSIQNPLANLFIFYKYFTLYDHTNTTTIIIIITIIYDDYHFHHEKINFNIIMTIMMMVIMIDRKKRRITNQGFVNFLIVSIGRDWRVQSQRSFRETFGNPNVPSKTLFLLVVIHLKLLWVRCDWTLIVLSQKISGFEGIPWSLETLNLKKVCMRLLRAELIPPPLLFNYSFVNNISSFYFRS